jgi:hypothetical protein
MTTTTKKTVRFFSINYLRKTTNKSTQTTVANKISTLILFNVVTISDFYFIPCTAYGWGR